jgi:hypothetical protein
VTNLADILTEFKIDVLDTRHQHKRGPGQTCAAGTLEEILRDYGEVHLRNVLQTIMETENNGMALVRPVMLAVSDIIIKKDWFELDPSKWFEVFDKIDLSEMHRIAKADKEVMKARHLVGGMILDRLRPHFSDETARLL